MSFPSKHQSRGIARVLGWFSIGLGVAELLAARPLARGVGLPARSGVVRGYGVREIATGIGLLNAREPAPWLWARVAGDALDLATLATARRPRGPRTRFGAPLPTGTALAVAAVAGVALVDLLAARGASRGPARASVDYGRRSGWPLPADEMRGAARNFEAPRDFRIPEALRPWTGGGSGRPAVEKAAGEKPD